MNNAPNVLVEEDFRKLQKKVTKMETLVSKLSSENTSLKVKVNNLETIIIKICSQIGMSIPKIDSDQNDKDIPSNNNAIEETWLYHIPKNKSYPKDKILKSLAIHDPDMTVVDIKVSWNDDREMYLALLGNLEKFAEFSKDFKGMTTAQISEYFYSIFEAILINDTVIILRGIPKQGVNNYDKIISTIGTLAGAMCKIFEESVKNAELIGKMALILESEEDLNILNIMKQKERLILSVEELKC